MRAASARAVVLAALPVLLGDYLAAAPGGVGRRARLALLARMVRNTRAIPTASSVLEHVAIVTRILRLPADAPGCVVECGCYKGGSTANLSLACALVGRRLVVFDSFAGLPEPSPGDRVHLDPHTGERHEYRRGDWRGRLEEVTANVRRYGAIGACDLRPGFFADTLPAFDEPCALAFCDVDLVESLRTCLRHLWPLMPSGAHLFTHEARDMAIVRAFFDADWWREELGCAPPGLVGAGTGLGLLPGPDGFGSQLAYTVRPGSGPAP